MTTDQHQFACKNCGFELDYAIGSHSLMCKSCDHVEPIEVNTFNVFHANPYEDTVLKLIKNEPDEVHHHVQCQNCGAGFDLPADVHADECPYCDSNVVVSVELQRQLKPDALLPFNIHQNKADESFKTWIKGLWFAPTELKRKAIQEHPIKGTYVPFWAIDADVKTHYIGQRGDNYVTRQMMPTRVNGKMVMRMKKVVKIRWRPASGRVFNQFNNVLVIASEKLPAKLARKMTHWDLSQTQQYNMQYLSGFRSELFQIGLPRGFALSKQIMAYTIDRSIRRDIGGDHQRITQSNSIYSQVGYKLLLAPLWISTFNYNSKSYRYAINGQNGKTYGERPYSWYKIIGAALVVAMIAGSAIMLSK